MAGAPPGARTGSVPRMAFTDRQRTGSASTAGLRRPSAASTSLHPPTARAHASVAAGPSNPPALPLPRVKTGPKGPKPAAGSMAAPPPKASRLKKTTKKATSVGAVRKSKVTSAIPLAKPTPLLNPSSTPHNAEEQFDHLVPEDVDDEGHVPAHIGFQALLEADNPINTDDLNMLDELSESVDGFDVFTDDFAMHEDSFQESIEDVVELPKKKARGGNYSVPEDEELVLAWQNVSLDPIIGKDQPGASYWQRISDYYHNKISVSRTIGSLNHRWTLIAECCTRWAGCVKNIERLHTSGSTMQDRLNATQELYKERDPLGRSFVMLHCWVMLQHNQKWIDRKREPNHPKKRVSSEVNEDDHDGDNEDGHDESVRPPGRKQSKARLKNGGEDAIVSAVQDIITTKKEIEASRKLEKKEKQDVDKERWEYIKLLEERKLAILREEASAKKMKEENNIMFKDMTGLDETQKAYVLAMRAKILASTIGGSPSVNDN